MDDLWIYLYILYIDLNEIVNCNRANSVRWATAKCRRAKRICRWTAQLSLSARALSRADPRCHCSPLSSVGCYRSLSAAAAEYLPIYNPRLRRRGLSPSVSTRPLISVCVLLRTHARGGGGIRFAVAPIIGRGFARRKTLDLVIN